MTQVFSVSSATELENAINIAEGGDTIELASGHYGDLFIRERYDDEVKITSADPDNPATFGKIDVFRSENITFDKVEVDFDPVTNDGYKIGVRIWESEGITVSNSTIQGGPNVNHPDPLYADANVGLGIQARFSDNIVIENNEISEFHAGVNVGYIDGLAINYNYINDVRTSNISGGATNDVEIRGNHLANSNPINFGGPGDHADMIHLFPLSNQVGPMENIVIADNFFEQGEGQTAILGIFLDDHTYHATGLGYENVVIENNILHNGNAQGLTLENVDGARIVDNTFLQGTGDSRDAPGILLNRGTENVEIDNNIIAGTIGGSSVGTTRSAENGIDIGDNLFVQNRDPFGDNYQGNLFFNGDTMDGDVGDFRPVPGSVADGYGANQLTSVFGDDINIAHIDATRGEHLDLRTITFDAQSLWEGETEIDIQGATIAWDFGDGATATGDNIAHTYDSAGSYEVTAVFTLPNGEEISVDRTVDVFTPEALVMNFENGVEDISDIENSTTLVGDVGIEEGRFGDALRLGTSGSRVVVGRSEEITSNPEFSISFVFQKDGGTETNSDDGMITYYSGTSFIQTSGSTLTLRGETSTGRRIDLRVTDDSIEDGDWHHVTYTFSAEAGSATLYLDGEEVDRLDGLTGIQHTTGGHDMYLGGRTGGAFGGLLDEYEFTRTSLSAEEVQTRYETLFEQPYTPEEEAEEVADVPTTVAPTPSAPQPDREPQPVQDEDPEPQPEQDEGPEPQPVQDEDPEPAGGGTFGGGFRLLTLEEEAELHGGVVPRVHVDDEADDASAVPSSSPLPHGLEGPQANDADAEEEDDEHLFNVFVNTLVTEYFPFLDGTVGGQGRGVDRAMIEADDNAAFNASGDEGRALGLFDLLAPTGRLEEERADAALEEDEETIGHETADIWF